MSKPEVIFVLGGPGCGKGTQCKRIVENFRYAHLSAGDLLRAERSKEGSEFKDLIEVHIKNGSIVPVEITCSLLDKAMKESECDKFLIDGFPRNDNNLTGWNSLMKDKVHVACVLVFECPKEICVNRCLGRGAAGSGRSDDNLESLKKRFETFLSETIPVIKHYEDQKLVKYIDATRSPDEVFEDVKKLISSFS